MRGPVIIELAGEPTAKGRPRFAMRGRKQRPIAYTPTKTRDYETALKAAAKTAMIGREPLIGAVVMHLEARLPIRVSWPKIKQLRAAEGTLTPTVRPDLDNLEKIAMDALQGVVFFDDAQIVNIVSSKRYSDSPGIKVEVSVLDLAA